MDKLDKISRGMSKILRHDPHPLVMDDKGWIDTTSLINHFNITFEELQTIVATNDKQRFGFNEDQTKIRANQGHSKGIADDKEYTRITALQSELLLYHGTDSDTIDFIKNDRILPGARQHVHWSANIEVATKRANQRTNNIRDFKLRNIKPTLVVLKARSYIHGGGKLLLSENNVYLTPEIPGNILDYIFIS